MATVRLAAVAMATRFELVLHGPNPTALRSGGEEAIAEIHRIDATLSAHRPESEIAALNRHAATQAVRVSPEVFRLLRHAVVLSQATQGAFDITVGPLLQAWGFVRGTGHLPDLEQLEEARTSVGSDRLSFDDTSFDIRFTHLATRVDLGAIGKGYALDRAATILQEAGVQHALLHGGTSTAIAFGQPETTEAWRIAIAPPNPESTKPLGVVELHDESLSVSAVWGKGFTHAGRHFGHVIDPRTGQPVEGAVLAALVLPSATETDALSTALLVRAAEMVERLRAAQAPARCLVAVPSSSPSGFDIIRYGIEAVPD